MSGVARRYATAAVEVAREQGGDEAVGQMAQGLRAFAEAYATSDDLREIVRNPAFERERSATLDKVGEALGLSPLVRNVIGTVSNNERIDIIGEIAAEAEAIADEQLGRARAHVTSAIELTPAQQQRLTAALERRVGKPVLLNVRVDPSILGGLVVEMGSVTIDSSIRRQLDVLSERLHSPLVGEA